MLKYQAQYMMMKVRSFLGKEKGAADIVAIAIMIAVVVAVGLVFQEKITEFVGNLLDGLDAGQFGGE